MKKQQQKIKHRNNTNNIHKHQQKVNEPTKFYVNENEKHKFH